MVSDFGFRVRIFGGGVKVIRNPRPGDSKPETLEIRNPILGDPKPETLDPKPESVDQDELEELQRAFDLVADGVVTCSRVSDDGMCPSPFFRRLLKLLEYAPRFSTLLEYSTIR
jgi:hypothetical protein